MKRLRNCTAGKIRYAMRTAASMMTPEIPSEPRNVRAARASSSEAIRTISRVSGGELCGFGSFTFDASLCECVLRPRVWSLLPKLTHRLARGERVHDAHMNVSARPAGLCFLIQTRHMRDDRVMIETTGGVVPKRGATIERRAKQRAREWVRIGHETRLSDGSARRVRRG